MVLVISERTLLLIIMPLVVLGSQYSLAQVQAKVINTTLSKTTSDNFQIYSNSAFGIKIQYPSNWLKLDLSRNSSSVLIVAFKTPAGSPLGSLNLLGGNVSGNVTLAALVNTDINRLRQSEKIFHLALSAPATFAGNPAHKIIYTTLAPRGFEFKAMQLISLVGKKAYFITYAVPAANYAAYLPTIETMISSAKITK